MHFRAVVADVLAQGCVARFRVHGTSMEPALRAGDIAVVSPDISNLHVGDIVLFQVEERWMLHRVTRIGSGDEPSMSRILFVRGDRPHDPEISISPRNLVGKLVGLEKSGASRRFRAFASERVRRIARVLNRNPAACRIMSKLPG